MAGLKYDKIIKYIVRAKCEAPLHIGSSIGGKEDVLIHPVDGLPFIQASSIAGVFRSNAALFMDSEVEELFGVGKVDKNITTERQSRIRFTDGNFDTSSLKMELRPHVRIDRKTGSVSNSKASGQKFDVEYIGAGAEFTTFIYLYLDSAANMSLENRLLELLGIMKRGALQFGAKKSSGAGKIVPISVKTKTFYLKKATDRESWRNEELLDISDYAEIIDTLPDVEVNREKYKIIINGKTEGAILVKGLSVSEFGEEAPDSINFQNANGDYIVPGSSLRGAIRSQMEKISSYLGKDFLIDKSFGKVGDKQEEGYAGNLVFADTVIGDRETNALVEIRHRIHIDKFTGGVFYSGLFAEKNAVGNMNLEISIINKGYADATLGLLLMAIRDLASKVMTLGSGFSTGKGFIDVEEIIVKKGKDISRVVYKDSILVEDDKGIIQNAMEALREVTE